MALRVVEVNLHRWTHCDPTQYNVVVEWAPAGYTPVPFSAMPDDFREAILEWTRT